MSTHNDDHNRDPGRCRRRGDVTRTNNRLHRRFPRGLPLPLVVLLLALSLLPPTVAPATARQATPSPGQDLPPEGVTTDRLIEATLDWLDLPGAVATLALTRVTLPPGAEATAEIGAHLFVVEAGALTVREYVHLPPAPTGAPGSVHENVPAGPPVTHGSGDQFLVTHDVTSPPAITNEGAEPAIALVVSIAGTGGNSIEESLTGWAVVEPLAVADAARVGPPLLTAGGPGAEPIAVALVRANYERAEVDPSVPPPFESAPPAARLFAVEAGALNVRVGNWALYTPADAAAQALPPGARVSLVPGDQLLALAPGRIAIRNVARGPSAFLIVSVGTAPAATVQG